MGRFLTTGMSQTVVTKSGVTTVVVTKPRISNRTSPPVQGKRKQRVKHQVVRVVPSPGDKDDDDDMDPNQLHDNDLGEAMVAGLYAGKIQELDSSRASVSS